MSSNGNGLPHEQSGKCPAHARSGKPCGHPAGYGTDHVGFGCCKFHGGATPAGRKNGASLRAKGEFGLLVEQCELEVQGRSLEEAIGDVIERTGAMALAWFQIVTQLQESATWEFVPQKGPQGSLQRWVTISVEGLVGPNAQGEQRVHVADEQYRKWLGMYLQANKVAADLGLEERKTRVQERQMDVMERAFERLCAENGWDVAAAKQGLARHLRVVEGGA